MLPEPLLPETSGEEQILEHILEVTSDASQEASAQRDAQLQATASTTDAVRDLEPLLELGLEAQVGTRKAVEETNAMLRETTEVLAQQGRNIENGAEIIIKGLKGDKPSDEELVALITPLIPAPLKGDDGATPTALELLAIIEPLIPEPIKGEDGHTPTSDELTALITPLIPKVQDGKTPTKAELERLITPLIPAPKEAKVPDVGPFIEQFRKELKLDTDERIEMLRNTIHRVSSRDYALTDLTDVLITNPTNGQVLLYNSTTKKWYNGSGGGGGAVDSVNGQTGVVVLDADDIDDTATTHKFVTAGDITKLGNLSGTNTGDQTSIVGISGTKAEFDTACSDGNFLYVGDVTQYTDEMAQDAVGTILTDSAEIDFTYNDGVPSITASIVAGSIDETKLDASVNASLDLADTSVQPATTQTLTNKRITRRLTTTNAPGATPTTNTDNVDIQKFTGLATAITSMTTNLSGTPVEGDMLQFQFLDNGTARAIAWGASFGSTTVALPSTTVISTLLRVGVQWNGSLWQCIAVA